MNLEAYLAPRYSPAPSVENDSSLDEIIHQKSDLQSRKLDILAAEMRWRLYLASKNLYAVGQDEARLETMVAQLDRQANYQLRSHDEKAPLYRQLFTLRAERRSQQTDCWRDVVQVMRDFLVAWEAHEQAQARARFLHDVGTTAEGTL